MLRRDPLLFKKRGRSDLFTRLQSFYLFLSIHPSLTTTPDESTLTLFPLVCLIQDVALFREGLVASDEIAEMAEDGSNAGLLVSFLVGRGGRSRAVTAVSLVYRSLYSGK